MSKKEVESGFDVAIGPSRTVLSLLGVWPDPDRKKRNFFIRSYFIFPALVMFLFCNIPQTVKAAKVFGDFEQFLEVLTTSNIPIAISLFKMLGIWYNGEGELVMDMSKDWKKTKLIGDLEVMKKNALLSRIMSIIIIVLAEGTIVAHFAMATFARVTESRMFARSLVNTSQRLRPLYMGSSFFYDIQSTPYYEITWVFQSFSTIFAASAFSAADAFFAVLVLHLCAQLKNLKGTLINLPRKVNEEENESFVMLISTAVVRHRHLIRFASTIEDAFNVIFLMQIIVSSIVLCLQGYQLVELITERDKIPVFELTFMLYYTTCFIFSLFVYCYVSEVLRIESIEIGNAVYECDWYNLTAFETRLFILIIMRAKLPFEITAGKFVAFSLQLFCQVLKSSGGYLSMLLAMKDRMAISEK